MTPCTQVCGTHSARAMLHCALPLCSVWQAMHQKRNCYAMVQVLSRPTWSPQVCVSCCGGMISATVAPGLCTAVAFLPCAARHIPVVPVIVQSATSKLCITMRHCDHHRHRRVLSHEPQWCAAPHRWQKSATHVLVQVSAAEACRHALHHSSAALLVLCFCVRGECRSAISRAGRRLAAGVCSIPRGQGHHCGSVSISLQTSV
jgi:hypothetical protein